MKERSIWCAMLWTKYVKGQTVTDSNSTFEKNLWILIHNYIIPNLWNYKPSYDFLCGKPNLNTCDVVRGPRRLFVVWLSMHFAAKMLICFLIGWFPVPTMDLIKYSVCIECFRKKHSKFWKSLKHEIRFQRFHIKDHTF